MPTAEFERYLTEAALLILGSERWVERPASDAVLLRIDINQERIWPRWNRDMLARATDRSAIEDFYVRVERFSGLKSTTADEMAQRLFHQASALVPFLLPAAEKSSTNSGSIYELYCSGAIRELEWAVDDRRFKLHFVAMEPMGGYSKASALGPRVLCESQKGNASPVFLCTKDNPKPHYTSNMLEIGPGGASIRADWRHAVQTAGERWLASAEWANAAPTPAALQGLLSDIWAAATEGLAKRSAWTWFLENAVPRLIDSKSVGALPEYPTYGQFAVALDLKQKVSSEIWLETPIPQAEVTPEEVTLCATALLLKRTLQSPKIMQRGQLTWKTRSLRFLYRDLDAKCFEDAALAQLTRCQETIAREWEKNESEVSRLPLIDFVLTSLLDGPPPPSVHVLTHVGSGHAKTLKIVSGSDLDQRKVRHRTLRVCFRIGAWSWEIWLGSLKGAHEILLVKADAAHLVYKTMLSTDTTVDGDDDAFQAFAYWFRDAVVRGKLDRKVRVPDDLDGGTTSVAVSDILTDLIHEE